MPNPAPSLRSLWVAVVLFWAAPVWAQRVQFPSMLAQDSSVYGGGVPASGSPLPPAGSTFSAPQPFNPGSMASPLPPNVQPVTPAWDPYGAPAAAQPYSPYAPSPFAPAPNTGGSLLSTENWQMPSILPENWTESVRAPLKLLQETRLRGTWLAPLGGSNKLGVTDIDLGATFAYPILYNQAPLLITPGFGFHFFNGPVSAAPEFADLPGVVYDAYLDTGWRPQVLPSVTPWLSADLGVRVGVYSDFHAVNSHSIRIIARGLGIITLTEKFQVVLGVVYLDRVRVKMLPAGGIIWTPSQDARYEIFFPNPKLARRLTTLRTTDVWWYVAGEYGGGSWTIRRANGGSDQFDYNDLRVMLGLEGFGQNGLHTFFEVGYVFDRELVYRSGMPSRFYPADTIMLRGGLSYQLRAPAVGDGHFLARAHCGRRLAGRFGATYDG